MSRTRTSTLALALAVALGLPACGDDAGGTGADRSTQASSAGDELVVLQDDKMLQTVGNVVPVVTTEALTPPMRAALEKVSQALATQDLVAMDRKVDVARETPREVARQFAAQNGLAVGTTGGSGTVVVAAAGSGEDQVLGNLFEVVLDAAGFDARVEAVSDREAYLPALQRGEVQVAAERVGPLTESLNRSKNGPDAPAVASGDLARTVAALTPLAAGAGLSVLAPSRAQHQDAFAVTRSFAEANDLQTLSDLAGFDGDLVLGGPPDCPTTPTCRPGLEETYGLELSGFVPLDAGGPLTKEALEQGRVQVGLVSSTDGSLSAAVPPGTR